MLRTISCAAVVLLAMTCASANEPRFLKAWGRQGTADGEFEFPIGIAIHETSVFITDHYNDRVQKINLEGKLLGGIQSGQGSEPGKFFAPHGIAINARGELFVVDSYNQRIQKFATK